jgi:hypothetical protein
MSSKQVREIHEMKNSEQSEDQLNTIITRVKLLCVENSLTVIGPQLQLQQQIAQERRTLLLLQTPASPSVNPTQLLLID